MARFLTVFTLLVCLSVVAMGQGRGKGGGGGGGRGAGNGGGVGGPPAGVGVERGVGNASSRSNGRSDDGLSNASSRSNGRVDAGHERARIASGNLKRADSDLRDHPGLAKALNTNANSLRSGYAAALAINPELKFGQYVSATRLGQNLGRRFPNISRDAILNGLNSGMSLGRTLQSLGLGEREAKEARKQVERELKEARRNE